MRTFAYSAIFAVTAAIKSQSQVQSASHAMVDAMVRSLSKEMPATLVQMAQSNTKFETLIKEDF